MASEYRIITDPKTLGFTITAEGVTADCKHSQDGFVVNVRWPNEAAGESVANTVQPTFEAALSWATTMIVVNPIMEDPEGPEGLPESIPVHGLAFRLEDDNHMYLCEHVGSLKQDGKEISISRTALSFILTLPVKHGRANARYLLDLGNTIKAAAPTMFDLIEKPAA